MLSEDCEWTCEANPGSSDAERFRLLAQAGVTRLSVGVQSTHPGAWPGHARAGAQRALEAERALEEARAAVPRVSADIIMGLPGQDARELDEDLALYRRHGLGHASVYHLTYEPGTEFHARRGRGEMADIPAERSLALYERLWDRLGEDGLDAYETSNFARSGEESRHNLAYWRQLDYHAAGAGAVSTLQGRARHPRGSTPGATSPRSARAAMPSARSRRSGHASA